MKPEQRLGSQIFRILFLWTLTGAIGEALSGAPSPNGLVMAQEPSRSPKNQSSISPRNAVLAYLGEQEITRADVDFQLGRSGDESTKLSLVAEQTTIHLIALQRQALQALRKLGLAVNRDQVDQWIESNAATGRDGSSAAEIIRSISEQFGIGELEYREFIAFRLSWQRYLAKHLNDKNLRRHFENQKARFDGTRFRIELVSIAVPAGESAARTQASERLADLRQKLSEQPENWGQVLEDTATPTWQISRERWVPGSGELDPTLIGALLELAPGEMSDVVDTATGVHLLRLLDREPGDLDLSQVVGEVRADMLVYLLKHLASQSRDQLPLRAPSE